MDFETFLSQRVFELRKEANLSQKALGEAIGLSHKAISTLESGARGISVEKLVALAEYFGVSIDYLVGRTDNREVNR